MEKIEPIEFPKNAWISGRETYQFSLELGEVVVPEINIWDEPGGISKLRKVIGKIPHGSLVIVLEQRIEDHNSLYFRVFYGDIVGWVRESFITWNWSNFTFIGTLKPADTCKNLDLKIGDVGITLIIKGSGIAIVTEGDPAQFDNIRTSVMRFINRLINASATLTGIALEHDLINWIEVPLGGSNKRAETVGFLSIKGEDDITITKDIIQTAHTLIPLMKISPYFDLAVSDYYQALRYPQHALIFLSRSIESIENHFNVFTKSVKGKGKETVMREMLNVKKSDVEYVTKRANASHRRHASPNASEEILPNEELAECFIKTATILVAFSSFLALHSGK